MPTTRDQEEWRDKKSLQVFVFDTYERDLIVAALLERLSDPEVAEQALKVLFQLQGPDLLQAEEHPANEVFFPIVVLSEVLRDRLALPGEVTYRFADAVNRCSSPRSTGSSTTTASTSASRSPTRCAPTRSTRLVRRQDRADRVDREARSSAGSGRPTASSTERASASKEAGALFAYPPKFELPRVVRLRLAAALAPRLPRPVRVGSRLPRVCGPGAWHRSASGFAPATRWCSADGGGDRFAVEAISEDLELELGAPSPSWLLAERDDVGQRALLGFDDYWNRDRVWVRKGLPLRLAGIADVGGFAARRGFGSI